MYYDMSEAVDILHRRLYRQEERGGNNTTTLNLPALSLLTELQIPHTHLCSGGREDI